MAVAVVAEFAGATNEQYDRVIGMMRMKPHGQGGPGQLFHFVVVTDEGTRITDVWKTPEQFEDFAQSKMVAATITVGVPSPPTITFYEVHTYFTAGGEVPALAS